jgi:hypothetical protein
MSGKSKAKDKDKAKSQAQETPTQVVPEPQEGSITNPEPEQITEPEPIKEPEPAPLPKPTLVGLQQEILTLKQLVMEHSGMIVHLQESLAKKRKPVQSNGKIQIRDKQTGQVYPSKNNCYQSLLKAGELKSLVDKGLFGDIPEKNTFGWYVLVREWPDRFEEVHEAQNSA